MCVTRRCRRCSRTRVARATQRKGVGGWRCCARANENEGADAVAAGSTLLSDSQFNVSPPLPPFRGLCARGTRRPVSTASLFRFLGGMMLHRRLWNPWNTLTKLAVRERPSKRTASHIFQPFVRRPRCRFKLFSLMNVSLIFFPFEGDAWIWSETGRETGLKGNSNMYMDSLELVTREIII